ncbi:MULTISPECIES: glycosyltransferase family 2 protein [unclassified Curtobacterium]|uniref:glycosyltransferase family 2 protein n=1 Tax=unclassified Curtobacterium TaxID=257496 RepID=UPI0015E879AF|nr:MULTISPECIES: glycosyltransferase family 2 protein [unclassified Curtobacterium]WIE55171.1 glycosyltransferase [Curtobacterium sp. MCBD17_003]
MPYSVGYGSLLMVETERIDGAAIVVTYEPSAEVIRVLLGELQKAGIPTFVVDNSSGGGAAVARAAASQAGVHYLGDGINRGIAWGHNRGLRSAAKQGFERVLLLDQDSGVDAAFLRLLFARAADAFVTSTTIAAVGCTAVDYRTGQSLIYREGRYRTSLVRHSPVLDSDYEAPFLLASGTIMRVAAYEAIGGFREDFFIDHVDREWGMRARSQGYSLVQFLDITMSHTLGDSASSSMLTGATVYHHASADRDYYLKRNTILMARGGIGSYSWRVGESFSAVLSTFTCLFRDPARAMLMVRGLLDGALGRGGPLP